MAVSAMPLRCLAPLLLLCLQLTPAFATTSRLRASRRLLPDRAPSRVHPHKTSTVEAPWVVATEQHPLPAALKAGMDKRRGDEYSEADELARLGLDVRRGRDDNETDAKNVSNKYKDDFVYFATCSRACHQCFLDHYQGCLAYCKVGCEGYCEEQLPYPACEEKQVWSANIAHVFQSLDPKARMCQATGMNGCPEMHPAVQTTVRPPMGPGPGPVDYDEYPRMTQKEQAEQDAERMTQAMMAPYP